jgi:DNA polymerase III sliding clamp (beta) subunit (PCNA family)
MLLRTDNDRLEITAPDLEVTIACVVEANVKRL